MSARERAPSEKVTGDRTASGTPKLSSFLRPRAVLDLVAGSKEELLRALAEVVVEDATPAAV